jgi:hypothetical protein
MKTMLTATHSAKLIFVIGLAFWNRPGCAQNESKPPHEGMPRLTGEQVKAVILAVEDEIYDYSQESSFIFAGTTSKAPTDRSATLSLYVNPDINVDGTGEVIYRDLPYGEVLRDFHIGNGGIVVFDSDPQIGFPVTQPSHLTEFMDPSELSKDKEHWLRGEFTIQIDPPKELVIRAAKRQLKRVGFSDFLTTLGRSRPK